VGKGQEVHLPIKVDTGIRTGLTVVLDMVVHLVEMHHGKMVLYRQEVIIYYRFISIYFQLVVVTVYHTHFALYSIR